MHRDGARASTASRRRPRRPGSRLGASATGPRTLLFSSPELGHEILSDAPSPARLRCDGEGDRSAFAQTSCPPGRGL